MAVLVLDVPIPAWNNVVFQAAMLGLDLVPDDHRETGNTVVEITGTWEKLNQVLTRIRARESKQLIELLTVMEFKSLDTLG